MPTMNEITELQKIISDIMVEMLMLDKKYQYADLLFGNPKTGRTVRATMHYVMALLDYGFSPDEAELERARTWFNHQFPREPRDRVDPIEMNRLMVMLHLEPENSSVKARLERLARQEGNNYYDVQPGWPEFDTLWALEAFTLARKQHVLDETRVIDTARLERRLDQLIVSTDLKRDKDIALALRLQYTTFGTLKPAHRDVLQELLRQNELNQGLWGMRENRWRVEESDWYRPLTTGRRITHSDVQIDPVIFRKIIISTCMVIENLIPLMTDYPDVKPAVQKAITLWGRQLHQENAVTTLRHLFPKPQEYDYLLVLSRTLRAFRAYVIYFGQQLMAQENTYLLRKITQLHPHVEDPEDKHSIKAALRSWLWVDLTGQVEKLRLGFSDSNLVRVQPFIQSPLTAREEAGNSLISYSLIVKYGPVDEINKERSNLKILPAVTQDYFVRIPEASYVDHETNTAYVVMEDLRDYLTLYEIHEALHENVGAVASQLGRFLYQMHDGGTLDLDLAPHSLVREIYLGRILEYVDRIFNFLQDNNLYEDGESESIHEIQYGLFECIGNVIRYQYLIEEFPAAVMHGDLHMRNIMVHGLEEGRSNDLKFKLIDLEFLRRDGDAAFDAGELLIDIELVSREERQFGGREELQELKKKLEHSYAWYSHQRDDNTFSIRMDLAKARALLRIAKGKTKRGQQFIHDNQSGQAMRLAKELIGHAHEALEFLRLAEASMLILKERSE